MVNNYDVEELKDSPTVEVRAYKHGELIGTKLCLTAEEAADLAASWEETPGVTCEVGDLSVPADESATEVEATDLDGGYSHGFDPET